MRTILLLISCMVSTFLVSQDITGTWNGALEVLPGNQLSIVFHVVEEGDGYVTTMDSPDQGALGIPTCLLYTSPSPRDQRGSRMPSSA